jgi:hypothetical protein
MVKSQSKDEQDTKHRKNGAQGTGLKTQAQGQGQAQDKVKTHNNKSNGPMTQSSTKETKVN